VCKLIFTFAFKALEASDLVAGYFVEFFISSGIALVTTPSLIGSQTYFTFDFWRVDRCSSCSVGLVGNQHLLFFEIGSSLRDPL
jgi:hypothetical protein